MKMKKLMKIIPETESGLTNFTGFLAYGLLMFAALIVLVQLLIWIPAQTEAKLFNQKYKTEYTTWDFMFAGTAIKDYLHQGQQKTHNIKAEIK